MTEPQAQTSYQVVTTPAQSPLKVDPKEGLTSHYLLIRDEPMPAGGVAYVARVIGAGRVRIVALIDNKGRAFITGRPIEEMPTRTPDLRLEPYPPAHEGDVVALLPHGDAHTYAYRSRGELLAFAHGSRGDGEGDERTHKEYLPYLRFMFACVVTRWLCPYYRQRFDAGIGTSEQALDLLDGICDRPLPDALTLVVDRIDRIEQRAKHTPQVCATGAGDGASCIVATKAAGMQAPADAAAGESEDAPSLGLHAVAPAPTQPSLSQASEPTRDVTGFERYARRLIEESAFEQTRPIVATRDVTLVHLASSGYYYLSFDPDSMTDRERDLLLRVESAINRIEGVRRVVADMLPVPSEEECSLVDTTIARAVGLRAGRMVSDRPDDNAWTQIPGAVARQGGEWDVRTRFAQEVESQFLPFRLDYEFACNTATGVFAIEFELPSEQCMPSTIYDPARGAWVATTRDERVAMAREYGLGVSLVLAGAAFASSVGMVLASVTARTGSPEGPAAFSLRYTRTWLLTKMSTVEHAVEESHRGPVLERALGELMQVFTDANGIIPWVRMDSSLLESPGCARSTHGSEDDGKDVDAASARMLPSQAQRLLRARTVDDLLAASPDDPELDELLKQALEDEQDMPLLAIAQLEALVDEYDQTHDALDVRWFEDSVSRALYPLAAESSEAGATDPGDDRPAKLAPNAYFWALDKLTQLNAMGLGDPERALQTAQRMTEVAPTVMRGYIAADRILADNGMYLECEEVLEEALSYATEPTVIDYLYYRLAFALWNSGMHNEAIACYAMVSPSQADFGELASQELAALLVSMRMSEKPGPVDARAALVEAGIPVAPTIEVTRQLACAATALVDLGEFGPAVTILTRQNPLFVDDAIASTLRSIIRQARVDGPSPRVV